MAIQDMKGTVSTTGMVNSKPAKIQAPDMSKMKMPVTQKKEVPPVKITGLRNTPKGVTVDEAIETFKLSTGKEPENLQEVEEFYKNRKLNKTVPNKNNLLDKIQNLTNEDKAVLATVLSPSVSSVLGKIAPELNPLLTQFTKEEENVVLPVSIVKNFASRKYPGTEQESIQSFVSDLAGQMEQKTTVPPDAQMVQAPESDVNYDAIDSDAMTIA